MFQILLAGNIDSIESLEGPLKKHGNSEGEVGCPRKRVRTYESMQRGGGAPQITNVR